MLIYLNRYFRFVFRYDVSLDVYTFFIYLDINWIVLMCIFPYLCTYVDVNLLIYVFILDVWLFRYVDI